ncbi:MAG TPA: hypothetical protein VFY87_26345 [Geminicoccaceae bacterium]|nr:hypothetical protein [Geminicoccaceae bacterium]
MAAWAAEAPCGDGGCSGQAAASYLDARSAFRGGAPDFTCRQEAGPRSGPSSLVKRIDLVLVATPSVLVRDVTRLGENVADKTRPLPCRAASWPSDHAGVAARLRF